MTRPATNSTRRNGTVRCAIYTRKSSEEGLGQEFNSLQAHTAPATTAVPGPSMGGTVIVGPQPVTLFNGVTPKNGFMAQLMANNNGICNINDNGPPGINFLGSNAGFLVAGYRGIQSGPASGSLVPVAPPGIFVTPPGNKPIGPVSIACVSFEDPSFPIAVEVRGW